MKKTRKILSILLALVMALSICTVAFAEGDEPAPVPTSGKCGENIDWSLTDGVLTITGTGAVEAQTREVEKEVWVEGEYDEETQTSGEGHYEIQTEEESYYPWLDAIQAGVLAQFGAENLESLFIQMYYGGKAKEIYAALYTAVTKLVIGEGITAFGEGAFGGDMIEIVPRSIILPSTLTSLGDGIIAALATEIVVNNPEINFETNEVEVSGYAGEIPWETLDDAFNGMMDMFSYMYGGETIYSFVEIAYSASVMAKDNEKSIAAINADESLTAEEKAERLAQVAAQEQYVLSLFKQSFGITGVSLAAIAADVLARVNATLGTSFESVEDLYVVIPGECNCTVWDEEAQDYVPGCNCCDCEKEWNEELGKYVCECGDDCECCDCADSEDIELSDALKEAIEAYQVKAEAADEMMNAFAVYALGTAPETEDEEYNEETEQYEPVTIALTPTPWLTVYGAKDSTAQAACEISQVKFVALDDAKAAFDAEKAAGAAAADAQAEDGDSDASKALIDAAKDEINAIAYDETKTPSENIDAAKAACEAINAKLATDLAAQRDADKRAADKDGDGGYSNNAFMRFIRMIIDAIKNFFSKIFG